MEVGGRRDWKCTFESVDDFLAFVRVGTVGWKRRAIRNLIPNEKFFHDERFVKVFLKTYEDLNPPERERSIEQLWAHGCGRTSHALYDAWEDALNAMWKCTECDVAVRRSKQDRVKRRR